MALLQGGESELSQILEVCQLMIQDWLWFWTGLEASWAVVIPNAHWLYHLWADVVGSVPVSTWDSRLSFKWLVWRGAANTQLSWCFAESLGSYELPTAATQVGQRQLPLEVPWASQAEVSPSQWDRLCTGGYASVGHTVYIVTCRVCRGFLRAHWAGIRTKERLLCPAMSMPPWRLLIVLQGAYT